MIPRTPAHTPGPWHNTGRAIYAPAPHGYTLIGQVVESIHAEPNARLIAAAPEMLAALRDALHLIGLAYQGAHGDERATALVSTREKSIRAAIALATGVQP